jgi:hypothetical protein
MPKMILFEIVYPIHKKLISYKLRFKFFLNKGDCSKSNSNLKSCTYSKSMIVIDSKNKSKIKKEMSQNK